MRNIFRTIFWCCAVSSALHAQQPRAATPVPVEPARPALSSVDDHLPAWLRFSGEYRMRLEGFAGGGFKPEARDLYALNRVRLNMRIAPVPWARLQVQAQDAQVFGKNAKPDAPPFEDTMDLRQAYVELGKIETPAVTLRVGRQELFFGEQRLVGHLNWTNTARSFDAARLTLQLGVARIDAFAASAVHLREATANKSQGGNNLHGIYGSIAKVIPNSTIEPYVLWRLARGTRTESGAPGATDRKVFGMRWAGKLPSNFDYSIEATGQTGAVGTDEIRAWASHWTVGFSMPKVSMKPRLVGEYNFASGDKVPGDGKQQTFDQLYPTGHDKYGLADQVGWRNIHDLRSGVELKPSARLTVAAFYHSWWLASTRDGLYNAAGALVASVPAGAASSHVGQEADIQATYTFSTQTSIGVGYANIFPGGFLKQATPGKQYRLPYVMLMYSF